MSRLSDEELFIKTAIDCSLLWHLKNYSKRTAAEVFLKTLVKGKRSKKFMRNLLKAITCMEEKWKGLRKKKSSKG